MKKKNLIFFLPEFIKGGAGNSILSLCQNLSKNKFHIHILCLGRCQYKYEFRNIAKIFELKAKKTLLAQNEIRKIINKVLVNDEKTLFISNLFHANVLTGLLQPKKKNLKFIFTDRTTLSELFTYFGFIDFIKKSVLKTLVKITYRKADLIIANSKKVAKDLGFFSKCKTTSVYPGSFNKFKKKVRQNNKSPKQIIWIGRLAKEKGVEILLETFNKINKKKYILKIVGDGPLRKKVESKINAYGLRNNIKLLGFQKKIFRYLKKSDLLINTSFFEGFPNVVIEALSHSVPVICSKSNGGINEILANGKYGDLFNISSKNNLDIKVNNFLKNPSRLRKMALSSKNHLHRFEKKKSARIYEKIFDNL